MNIYVISDTHFDHENIIKYCDRPFESLDEMDSVMKENWNKTISPNDIVLFGGDLAMAREEVALEYASQLNGHFIFIYGNHDDITPSSEDAWFPVYNYLQFTYRFEGEDFEFYYVHWPRRLNEKGEDEGHMDNWPSYSEPPNDFDGWVLHGHVHNNDIEQYPFVNPEDKYINLSVEVVDYTPISLDTICQIIRSNKRYETVKDVPNHFL